MVARTKHSALLVLVAVLGAAASIGSASAALSADASSTSHRSLQQKTPSMNLPVLVADDMEKGFTPPKQYKPQPQVSGYKSKGSPGRKLQQARGWANQGQPWVSQPIRPVNQGQARAQGQAGSGSWDNTGVMSGTTAGSGAQAGSWGFQGGNQGGNQWGSGNQGGNQWGGRKGNPGQGRGRPWRNNKGDRSSLTALTGNYGSLSGIRAQPILATGNAASLSQGIRRRGNARAAAQSLAKAYSSGQADAAAQAVASAATSDNDAESSAAAETVAEATVNNPDVAPQLLAKSANLAVSRGQTDKYAQTIADAFGYSKRQKKIPQFTEAVTDAIATGDTQTKYAYGQAIATAISDGGDSKAAVAEATATAFCAGGDTAQAWSQAYAVALSQNSQGCLVLNQAKAIAEAKCADKVAEAATNTEATSTVLGFCGLMNILPSDVGFNWGSSSTGSSTTGTGSRADGSGSASSGGN